jgi:hypothetical protein
LNSIIKQIQNILRIRQIVLAIVCLVFGLFILWLSLGWLLEDPVDPKIFTVEGRLVKYDFSDREDRFYGELMLEPVMSFYDTLNRKVFYIKHKKSFKRKEFEKLAGGLGSTIKLGIDSAKMKNSYLEIYSLEMGNTQFVDKNIIAKAVRTNQWSAFACAILALIFSFAFFKLSFKEN